MRESVSSSPNAEPKLIYRYRSNLISQAPLANISSRFFSFPPTPKIKGSSHEKKNKKILFSQKWLQRFSLNFVGVQYIRCPTIWHYRLSPEKFLKLQKQFLIFCPSPNVAPKPTGQSHSHSISRVPLQIQLAHFFSFQIYPEN